ncbi:MAG: HXXEE domain-containing protein [Oscillospiraceae bacterium]|nr:HXXEE domain-containing protein [Oscillospiraceae bacterium]
MKRIIKKWLDCWLYVIILIAGVVLGVLIYNWSVWDWGTRLFAFATILLPIHVLEEWHFPGGFHTMYNLMAKSDKLDRYPMNQLSDMWTNFIGVVFGCVVLLVGVNPIFLIMQLFLCCAEMYGHFSGGIFTYKNFRDKGKKTIYNPGLLTTIIGYIPIAVGIVICLFATNKPQIWQIPAGLVCAVALGAFSLKAVENLCKDESSSFAYTWGNGYFEKYVK